MSTRRLLPLIATGVVGLAIAGCGGNTSTASTKPATSSGRPAAIGVSTSSTLGRILVDSQGRTLYLFKADTGTRSTCNGACAVAWPPLRTGHMAGPGSGVDAAKVGMTTRSGGGRQITYNGHPLYRFDGDHRAGDTNGQGVTAFGASWFAVSPDGNAASGSTSSSGGYGGY